jgi:hypothetical protein
MSFREEKRRRKSRFSSASSSPEEPDENRRIDGGRFFHELWVTLTQKYSPDSSFVGHLVPWDELEEWEQKKAIAIYEVIQHFLWTMKWPHDHLPQEEKGQFVYICWLAQNLKQASHFERASVVEWKGLSEWQREVFIHIFENIEEFQEVASIPHYLLTELRYTE